MAKLPDSSPLDIISSDTAYATPYLSLERISVQYKDENKPRTWHRLVPKYNSVFIVPVNSQGEVTLIGSHRVPVNRWFWEVPSGGIDPNEDPETAARRELREEARQETDQWENLGRRYPLPYMSTEETHIYLALDVRPAPVDVSEQIKEHIAVSQNVPAAEVKNMILRGEIDDQQSIAALAIAFLRLDEISAQQKFKPSDETSLPSQPS